MATGYVRRRQGAPSLKGFQKKFPMDRTVGGGSGKSACEHIRVPSMYEVLQKSTVIRAINLFPFQKDNMRRSFLHTIFLFCCFHVHYEVSGIASQRGQVEERAYTIRGEICVGYYSTSSR